MKAEDLLLAMRSCNNNLNTIDMKMTGRSTDAYLSFTIASSDSFGNPRVIVQNVPIIKILTENNANDTSVFEEPLIPDPEVHIMLPHLERLRHVMSSYKNIADYVVVSANLAGDMVFTTSDGIQHQFDATFNADSAATENDDDDGGSSSIAKKYGMAEKARVETRFVKLFNPVMRGDDEDHPYLERQRTKPKEFASVLIRVLDLQKVLQSHYVKPLNVICSIVPSHSILFYVYIKEDTQDATLTYFIPEIK
ncbi:hypothetical protein BGZ49_003489 [Haplosporangium sp. Z 27]|nr:hypothetical protein BGZ49_003489 [Haplosporangium sp. Z 27]